MENNIRAIDSIVKARDDRTIDITNRNKTYLYSLILSHVEHIQSNLYNFKFIGKVFNPDSVDEIYMNLQLLINDSSIVDNSKYALSNNQARLTLVNSYKLDEKETQENSYRIDFSMNGPEVDEDFFKLEIVNTYSNSSSMIHINKAIFFKVSIFLYQLLNNNIIDGDIFYKKLSNFRIIFDKARYEAYKAIKESDIKVYIFYWNNIFILAYFDTDSKDVLTYMTFSREEYENLINNNEEI